MSDDRYGISAYFEFVEKGGSLATIDRIESALKSLENTIKGTAAAVANTNIGGQLGSQFKGANQSVNQATNSIAKFGAGAAHANKALLPLKSEFRALRAESRNIDFGDLNDTKTFAAAKSSVHEYIEELKKLERQVTGNTAADRQFKAELSRSQTIATNKVEIADIQRNSAIASQKAGTSTAIAGSAAAVAFPMVGMGKEAVNVTANFDDQMSAVEAVLNAQDRTSENMLKLREQAKSIGASTKFSATDAAAGLVLLAQSGQSVESQLKSIAGTTLLAAAGGLDLASATDITVSSLGQFRLKADRAVHVANVLAYNAGAANLGVADLGESLKYAGPAADAFGASFEETNAILDVFSESGIKGSSAGTALKTMFINLASPSSQAQEMMSKYNITVKDSAGKMLPTVNVMEQLQSKLSGLSSGDQLDAVSTIFGKEATPAALSIVSGGATKMKGYLEGGKNVDTIKGAKGAIGSAAVQAGIMENNVGGSFRNLSSAIEGVQIEMGEVLVPVIRLVTDTLSGMLTAFIDLPKPIKTAITVTATLVTGLAAITAVVASGAAIFFTLQSAIGASAIATTLMSSTLVPLTGFANAAIASFGVSGLSGVMGVLTGGVTGVGTAIGAFASGALAVVTSPMAIATAGALALYAALEILTPGFSVLGAVISAIAAPIGLVFGFAQGLATGVGTALAPVISQLAGLKIAGTGIGEAFAIAGKVFGDFAAIGATVGNAIGIVLGITIATPLRGLIALFGFLSASAQTFGQIASLIAAPFVFAVQAITAAWTGFVSWFMSMPLVQFAQDLGMGLINALNHNPTVKIPIAWQGAIESITGMFSGLLDFGKTIGSNLVSAFNPARIVEMLPSAIGAILENFSGLLFGAFSIVSSAVMAAISSPVTSVLSVGAAVIESLKSSWTGFTDWLTSALMAVPNAVADSFSKILPPFLRTKKGDESPTSVPQTNPVSAIESLPQNKKGDESPISQFLRQSTQEKTQSVYNPIIPKSPIAPVQLEPVKTIPVIQSIATETSKNIQSSFDKLDLSAPIAAAKTSFNGFGTVVETVRSQFGGLVQSALIFGATTLLSLSPTVLVFGGIALAIAVVTSNFLGLRTIAIGIGKVFVGLFETLRGIIEILSSIVRVVGSVGAGITGIIGGIPAALKGDFSIIQSAFDKMTAGLKMGFDGILSGAGRVGSGLKGIFSGVLQIARGVGEGIGQVVNAISFSIKAIPVVIGAVADAIKSSWKAVSEFVSGLPIAPSIEFLKALPSKISELFDRIKGVVKSAIEFIGGLSFIPSIEGLKALPAMISGILDRSTATVKSAIEYVGNLPFMPSVESLKSLPTVAIDVLKRCEKAVKSVLDFVGSLHFMPSIESLKNLPATVNGVFDRAMGVARGAIEYVGNLPFIPSVERFKSLPSEVSAIVDRAKDFVKGAVNSIANLPFIPSIDAIKELPSKVAAILDRVSNSVKSAIAFVGEIWQSLRLPFPEINLQNITSIPTKISSMIDSAIGLFKGGVEQISAAWNGLKSIDNIPLLEGTINLLKSIPAIFEAVVEKIKGMWSGLGEKFGGILGGMGSKAKSIGKSLISSLSENSPGPTYQIRIKWASTTAAIGEKLDALKGEAKIKGQQIAQSLSGPLEAAKSKGASALGRSASSIGMVLSNFAPNLAAPLFAIGDMVDTVDTLSTSLPEAKKFFSGLIPEAGKLKSSIGAMIPVLGDRLQGATGKSGKAIELLSKNIGPMTGKLLSAIGPMSKKVVSSIGRIGASVLSTIIPMAGTVMSSFISMAGTVLSAVIPMVGTVISAIVSMAGAVASAVIPLVLPFLPIIAIVGAVIGSIALLKVAFDSDFMGIKTMIYGVGDSIKNTFSNAFSLVGTIAESAVGMLTGLWDGFAGWIVSRFLAIPSAIGDALSSLVPDFLKNKDESKAISGSSIEGQSLNPVTAAIGVAAVNPAPMMNPIAGAANRVQGAWSGFGDWFKGSMGGLVAEGEGAGEGLVNALNHNPTVRIPIAWQGAISQISGMMSGMLSFANSAGEGLVNLLGGAAGIVGGTFKQLGSVMSGFGLGSLVSLLPVLAVMGGVGLVAIAIATNFLGLKTIASGIGNIFTGLLETLHGVIDVLGGITRSVAAVGAGITGIIGGIPAALKGDFSVIQSAFDKMAAGIRMGFDGILSGAGRVGSGLEKAFSGVLQIARGVGEGVGQVVNAISFSIKAIPVVIGAVADAIKSSWKAVSGFVASIPIAPSIEFLKALPSKISELFDRIKGVVKSAIEFIGGLSFIPSIEGLKALPAMISGILDRSTATVKSAIEYVGNLPFKPSIERFKSLPGEVSAIVDRAKDFVKGAVNLIADLPFIPSIDAIKELPSKVAAIFDRVSNSVKSSIAFVGEIWQSLRLPFPEINLQNITSIPTKISSMVDSAIGLFKGCVEQISAVWNGLKSIDNIPLLEGTINLLKSIPAIFEAVVEKIKGMWSGLGEKFGGILGGMGDKAKSIGKSFVSALSENSPGPTYQIRLKWAMTTASIGEKLDTLKGEAKIKGQQIAQSLSGPLEAAKSKGASALGRSASSIGMVLSNFAPNLAAPLFAIGDMVDTVDTLRETLPDAKKFFSGLVPEAGKLKGAIGGMLPVLGEGLKGAAASAGAAIGEMAKNLGPMSVKVLKAIGPMSKKVMSSIVRMGSSVLSTVIPMAGTVMSSMFSMAGTVLSAVIPMVGTVISAIVSMAGAVMSAVIPLVLPFLPIIAILGAVIGAIALLKVAFDSDFLGIKTMIFGVGDSIKNTFTNAFSLVGTIAASAVGMLTDLWDGFAGWIVGRFLAIPSAIGDALSSLVPGFLKKKDKTEAIPGSSIEGQAIDSTPIMNPIAGAADRIQGAWTGFGDWFKGSMSGLVVEGEGAGEGLVNALNHNPTVRIPIAWQGATGQIGGMLSGMLSFANSVGEGLVNLLGGAAGIVSNAFKQLGSVMSGFGLGSLVSLLPVLAVMGGVALIAIAIGTNFLGLRTIAIGVFSAISGAIQGVVLGIKGVSQIIQGISLVIRGILSADISLIAMGFDQLFAGIRLALSGLLSAVRSVFGGALSFVQGAFEAFGEAGKTAFNSLKSGIQSLGAGIKTAIESPLAAWNGFLNLLDSIESKIRGVGAAIASSPIGALAGGLKAKFQGKSSTVVEGVAGAEFDQKVQAIDPIAKPQIGNKLRTLFSKSSPQPTTEQTSSGFVRVDDATKVNPLEPKISDRIRKTDTTKLSPSTAKVEPRIDNAGSTEKPSTMGAAAESVGAVASIVDIVAPNFAGPLNALTGLLSSVLTLATAIPVLSGAFTSLIAAFTATGAAGVAAGAGSTTAAAGVATATGVTAGAGLTLSGVLTGLATTASAAWAAVTGPLLPIVAAIGLVVAAVGLVYVAFQNNFLGIADLIGGVVGVFGEFFNAIVSGFSEIFGGIADQFDRSVGGIFAQLQILGQTIIKPFKPLMILFGGEGGGIGSAIGMMVSNALIPFKLIATAIGFVIGYIGKMIEVIIVVGSVIAEIILQPASAIVGVIGAVFSAIGRLGSAIMQPFSALGEAWNKLTSGIQGAGNQSIQFGDVIRSIANTALLPMRVIFGAIGLAISGVGFAIEMLINGFTLMAKVILLPVTAIGFLINGIVAIGSILGTALMTPLNFLAGLFNGFIGLLSTIPAILMAPFNGISGVIGGIGAAIAAVGAAMAGIPFIGGIFSAITGIQAAPQQETQYFASGGIVQGSGVGDRVPAKLTPGEFVVTPRPAAAALPLLEALNAGGVGAMLAALPMALPQILPAPIAVPVASGAGAGGFGDIAVNLNVQNITVGASGGAGDSPQAQAMEILDQLAPHLRRAVADILRDLVEKTR